MKEERTRIHLTADNATEPPTPEPTERPSKRVQRVIISHAFIEALLLGDKVNIEIQNPLPKDAKLVFVWFDPTMGSWIAYFESKKFPPVYEGHTIPHYSMIWKDLGK